MGGDSERKRAARSRIHRLPCLVPFGAARCLSLAACLLLPHSISPEACVQTLEFIEEITPDPFGIHSTSDVISHAVVAIPQHTLFLYTCVERSPFLCRALLQCRESSILE